MTLGETYTLGARLTANTPEFIANVAESLLFLFMHVCLIPR